MNPEKRFGQIEEVLAEALVKIDRIEDLATKTFSIAEEAKHNGETTARAVANLTIELGEVKKDVKLINTKIDQVQEGQRDIMNFLREKFS
jgi:chromosome segregation ATPase